MDGFEGHDAMDVTTNCIGAAITFAESPKRFSGGSCVAIICYGCFLHNLCCSIRKGTCWRGNWGGNSCMAEEFRSQPWWGVKEIALYNHIQE